MSHYATTHQPQSPQDTPVGKAKIAVGKAKSLEELDAIRRRVDERGQDGTFTANDVADLVNLITTKAEMLIAAEESGQEFAHEAAEHEVTA